MSQSDVQALIDAGAHFGYSRTRRHPSAAKFIFATKDRTDLLDLGKTSDLLTAALSAASAVAAAGRQVLFVGGKAEVAAVIKSAAESVHMPYVAGRWVGGTLTNFKNIRGRLDLLERRMEEREKGELSKYTKRERLMIDREIEELLGRFGGLVSMCDIPGALFVVDTRHEDTAVREANQLGIPVIALASTDCNFNMIQHPIPANDAALKSVKHVVEAVVEAISAAKKTA
jgi:small subunit ribosomal protein S2